MALAAVRSKAMILRLFIHCLLLLPLSVGFLCWVHVLLCSTFCPFKFCNQPAGEKSDDLFLNVCGCDISWSYSLTFWAHVTQRKCNAKTRHRI